jgi:hypothetical protein
MNLIQVKTISKRKMIPSCNLAKFGEESLFQTLSDKFLEIAIELESKGFSIWQEDNYFLCEKSEQDYFVEIRIWENVESFEIYPTANKSAEEFYIQYIKEI